MRIDLTNRRINDDLATRFAQSKLRPAFADLTDVALDVVDLSNNPNLGERGISAILAELCAPMLVTRLKANRTAADDSALNAVATWVLSLPEDGRPQEVHMTHCRITDSGISGALELARVLPQPLWLAVGYNDLSASFVSELVDRGDAAAEKFSPPQRPAPPAPKAVPRAAETGEISKVIAKILGRRLKKRLLITRKPTTAVVEDIVRAFAHPIYDLLRFIII
jgi:hypothetical protein